MVAKRWSVSETAVIVSLHDSYSMLSLGYAQKFLKLFGFVRSDIDIFNKLCWLDDQHNVEYERTRIYNDGDYFDLICNSDSLSLHAPGTVFFVGDGICAKGE